MRTIDLLSWELVKIALLIQDFIILIVASFVTDSKLSQKLAAYLISSQVLRTMSLEDLPSVARDRVLQQGRFLLMIISIGIIYKVFY